MSESSLPPVVSVSVSIDGGGDGCGDGGGEGSGDGSTGTPPGHTSESLDILHAPDSYTHRAYESAGWSFFTYDLRHSVSSVGAEHHWLVSRRLVIPANAHGATDGGGDGFADGGGDGVGDGGGDGFGDGGGDGCGDGSGAGGGRSTVSPVSRSMAPAMPPSTYAWSSHL